MRKNLLCLAAALVCAALLVTASPTQEKKPGTNVPPPGAPPQPKEKPSRPKSFKVTHVGIDPQFVLVELYHEGKVLRSREVEGLGPNVFGQHQPVTFTWANMPLGRYELHFYAKGYPRSIKCFVLAEDDPEEIAVRVEMDKEKSYIAGGGPAVQELAAENERLKRAHAALQAQLRNSPTPPWEFKAVLFGSDEKVNTKHLKELGAEGWEYGGPLGNGLVAFKRRTGQR
jgi:hypothetical protein